MTFLPTEINPAIVVVSGRDRPFEELPTEIAAQMAEERAAELVGLEDTDTPITRRRVRRVRRGHCRAASKRQIITAPLKGPGGVAGTLRVSMNWGDTFGDSDRQLLEMFANHASVALHNSKLIEELRAEVAQREHQAMHDRLTALPNRVMFDLQTRHALDRREDGELVSVMLVDLDRFKEVNDTLGHGHGDELLERLGDRLGMLNEGDRVTVARLGGDEFGILLRDVRTEAQIDQMASQVKSIIETPVEIAGVLIDVGASLGLAVAPRDGDDATTLLQRADVAMYVAKAGHRGVVRYEPGADPYSSRRLSLAADLRRAVENGEIETHFQPITSLEVGSPIAVEALARWNHPEHGLVPPDVFIPIAEQSGLIRDLTFLVLDNSLEQARKWRSQGFEMAVGVNLSVRCLTDDDLVARIGRHLDRAGADPASLKLEVTEGTIMADPVRAIAVLEDLHSLGVSLAIDDFGMGFSSLNQLKRMPVVAAEDRPQLRVGPARRSRGRGHRALGHRARPQPGHGGRRRRRRGPRLARVPPEPRLRRGAGLLPQPAAAGAGAVALAAPSPADAAPDRRRTLSAEDGPSSQGQPLHGRNLGCCGAGKRWGSVGDGATDPPIAPQEPSSAAVIPSATSVGRPGSAPVCEPLSILTPG